MFTFSRPLKTHPGDRQADGTRPVVPHDGSQIALFSDIADRATLRRTEDLEELERSIIETGPMGIIATDTTGTIVAMNSAAERLTLYRRRELVGEHSLILLHDPAELSSHAVRLNECAAEPVSAGMQSLTEKARRGTPENCEWTYIRKDGSRIWVNATITALQTSEGRITGYLSVAFDITEHKKFSDSRHMLEMYDQLTGLPNRTLLLDCIAHGLRRATRFGQRLALYLINLDQFERFNASLGMAGGDAILKHVALQLQGAVRNTDTVARIAGDEFVVVMPDFRGTTDAERCAELLQHRLATPLIVGDREVQVTASIGICLYPDCAGDIHELLSNAHAAMRTTKIAGRASQQLYVESQKTASLNHLEFEEELRHALRKEELFLEYQPQIECLNGEVTGFEALLRWRHKKRGVIPPVEFIHLAEDLGIMGHISEWVFERACADCVDMQKRTGKPLVVAVNLSARQFAQRDLPSLVEKTLQSTGLRAEHLELEITEQMLMVNSPRTRATLQAIRKLGVGIAIDDFGTGFSSFSYILDYQVDRIKIDRSFVSAATADSSATAVTKAIISMAHELKMVVVAEGVETTEQFDFLSQQRCDSAQGFLFSRPISKDDLLMSLQQVEGVVTDCRGSRRKVHTMQPCSVLPRLLAG